MATPSKPWWETWQLTVAGFDITGDLTSEERDQIRAIVKAIYNRKWKSQAVPR